MFALAIDPELNRDLDRWLAEDIGPGDLTSAALVDAEAQARAVIVAKAPGVLAGGALVAAVYARLSPSVAVDLRRADGDALAPGDVVTAITGPARPILAGERVALNLVARCCGIATLTRRFREAAGNPALELLDTRKTTPGLRRLEKYAVRCGGGTNHRTGLYDAILVKENHFHARGAKGHRDRFESAVRAALAAAGGRPCEFEVETMEELAWATAAGARLVMLDNFATEALARAVAWTRAHAPGVVLEASGGVSLDTIAAIARTGVDRVSVGALTHSAPALDLSMRFDFGGER